MTLVCVVLTLCSHVYEIQNETTPKDCLAVLFKHIQAHIHQLSTIEIGISTNSYFVFVFAKIIRPPQMIVIPKKTIPHRSK